MRKLKSPGFGKENVGSRSSGLVIPPIQASAKLVARSIPDHWNALVPEYKSKSYPGLLLKLEWNQKYAEAIERISGRRTLSRIKNYIDREEVERAQRKWLTKGEASIRFGVSKTGHGYNGERGDFCLVGGVIRGEDLIVLYRSLELIGGFAYDLTLVHHLGDLIGIRWETVTIFATKANVFALRGNSNEKLYPKLQGIFRE